MNSKSCAIIAPSNGIAGLKPQFSPEGMSAEISRHVLRTWTHEFDMLDSKAQFPPEG
jgi:hypothetical protein